MISIRLTQNSPARRGFSLIELLVVIAVITILMAMLLPGIQKLRSNARLVEEQNNLRQIGFACEAFDATFRSLPSWGGHPFDDSGEQVRQIDSAHMSGDSSPDNDESASQQFNQCSYLPGPGQAVGPKSHWSPFYQILPFLGQKNVHELARENCYGADRARGTGIDTFQSPLSSAGATIVNSRFGDEAGLTLGTTAFAFCAGGVDVQQFGTSERPDNGAIGSQNAPISLTRISEADGTSNTFLAGTKYVDEQASAGEPQPGNELGWWAGQWPDTVRWIELLVNPGAPQVNYQPDSRQFQPGGSSLPAMPFGGGHSQGGTFLFADGHVQQINFTVSDPGILRAAATRNGHEVISTDQF